MAPKRPRTVDEEVESEVEESSSEEEASAVKKSTGKTSDDEEDGDSGSDSDSAKVKKPPASGTPTKSAKQGMERQRKKKKKDKSGDDPKKPLFKRVWSEEDEIIILEGMLEYHSKKGRDPQVYMNAFFDFIKKSLHVVEVSREQLKNKVRRLRKKYHNAVKGLKGEDRIFAKPLEQKSFDLSKKIWGAASASASASKHQNLSHYPNLLESIQQFYMSLPCLGESIIIKEGMDLLGSSKAKELEEKWKKLHVTEIEVYLNRLDLMREQMKLILDAVKLSKS